MEYKNNFKRIFDVAFSTIALIPLIPFFCVIALIILIDSKGPVFFVQDRLGKNKAHIKVYKFRTMYHIKRQNELQAFKNDPRITKVGYYLRRFKIDEMPQFFSVLKGEMSVVGPRPCLPESLDKFDLSDEYRFNVKPGLTSLAGVNGSIYLSWSEKWWYDRYYSENVSFLLDVKIIFKTIMVLILGEDKFINHPKQ